MANWRRIRCCRRPSPKRAGSGCIFSGLVSDGGVHQHQEHLIALAEAAQAAGVDGHHGARDHGWARYFADRRRGFSRRLCRLAWRRAARRSRRSSAAILRWIATSAGSGPRWRGTRSSSGAGERSHGLAERRVSAALYAREPRGDEFLQPMIFSHANEQRIRDGDVVLFFNFRADRARQLSLAFLCRRFRRVRARGLPRVHYVTLTEYDETYACAVRLRAAVAEKHPRRSRQCRGHDATAHRGDGEISARHFFF